MIAKPKYWKVDAIDSLHDVQLPHGIHAVTYEPHWQGIRLSVSLKSMDSLRRTLGICKAYTTASVTDNEYKCRLFRVKNLLAAVKVYDIRCSVEKAEAIQDTIAEYGLMVAETDKHVIWDWHEARKQIPTMYNKARGLFDMMYAEFTLRATRGKKKELRYFLAILNEVINGESSP